MMTLPERIKLNAIKDDDGNVVVVAGDLKLTGDQMSILFKVMPAIEALPFDGSLELSLEGERIVIAPRSTDGNGHYVDASEGDTISVLADFQQAVWAAVNEGIKRRAISL